eukprot:SAG31_NODE_21696_length_540_cov_0.754505_1_plen_75_part_01
MLERSTHNTAGAKIKTSVTGPTGPHCSPDWARFDGPKGPHTSLTHPFNLVANGACHTQQVSSRPLTFHLFGHGML